MKILAIDTAFNACSVCFLDETTGHHIVNSVSLERGHAERLVPMIEEVMQKSLMTYSDLDAIAVTNGPGAFTGMRIGISTAKALALSLNKKLIAVESFSAFLSSFSKPERKKASSVAVLLETKRSDYYFAVTDSAGAFIFPPECVQKSEAEAYIKNNQCIIIGDAVDRFNTETSSAFDGRFYKIEHPDILQTAKYVCGNIESLALSGNNISPLYLRNADVTMPKTADRCL